VEWRCWHPLHLIRVFVASRVEKNERGTRTDAFVSSASGMSTDDDDTDDDTHTVIGRRGSVSIDSRNSGGDSSRKPPRAPSPVLPPASNSDGSKVNGRTNTLSRRTFTRSRSPAPSSLGLNGIMPQPRPPSPTIFLRLRGVGPTSFVLPGTFSATVSLWMTPWQYRFCIDAKHAAEAVILILALAFATQRLRSSFGKSQGNDCLPFGTLPSPQDASHANICTLELYAVIFASSAHMVWNHSSCTRVTPLASTADPGFAEPPQTPRLTEPRAPRRGIPALAPPIPENRGYVWMTVPKNYRSNPQSLQSYFN